MSQIVLNTITAPATPATGKAVLYLDNADNRFKVKLDDGTILYLSAGDTPIPKSLVDAKGDLIVATAADTVARLAVGADGKVLEARASESTGAKWVDPTKDLAWFRQAGTSPVEAWYAAGCMSSEATTLLTVARDVLRAIPFFSGRGGTLDRIALDVTTAGTVTAGTGKARMGIYTSTSASNLYPDTLVLDAGEVVVTTTGHKPITISQALNPNALYWFVMNHECDLTVPSLRHLSAAQCYPIFGMGPPGWGSNLVNHLLKTSTYAALPTPFPSGSTNGFAIMPVLGVRYSA